MRRMCCLRMGKRLDCCWLLGPGHAFQHLGEHSIGRRFGDISMIYKI